MAKKTKEALSSGNDRDELAATISETLNKTFAGNKISYFIGQEETPTDLDTWASTGSSLLDLCISNRKNGGAPFGRLIELSGLEQSGKSLIAAHMMKSVQDAGGVACLLDTENALNEQFYNAIGLDFSRINYVQPECAEDVFTCIEKIIEVVRRKDGNKRQVIIVVDSIAASPTRKEIEGLYELSGYGMEKAKLMSQSLRKICGLIAREKILLVFTNQLREKIGGPVFGEKYVTTSGKSLAFYASARVRLQSLGKVQTKDKLVIGSTIKATVVKNRMGPPHKSCEFVIYFDRGVDDLQSWLKYAKEKEIVKTAGAYCSYVDANGEEYKFQSGDWVGLLTKNVELKDEIYTKICDASIMSYSSVGLSPDDVELDTTGEE